MLEAAVFGAIQLWWFIDLSERWYYCFVNPSYITAADQFNIIKEKLLHAGVPTNIKVSRFSLEFLLPTPWYKLWGVSEWAHVENSKRSSGVKTLRSWCVQAATSFTHLKSYNELVRLCLAPKMQAWIKRLWRKHMQMNPHHLPESWSSCLNLHIHEMWVIRI